MWNTISDKIVENRVRNEVRTTAIDVSDQLLKSSGVPSDWETRPGQNFSIGLVDRDNKLNINKTLELKKMNYPSLKTSLGVSAYGFYFKVTDLFGNILSYSGNNLDAGLKPTSNASMIVNSKRLAIWNNNIVSVDVVLWL